MSGPADINTAWDSSGETPWRPTALITGASSGIGLALAQRLAPHYRLVLTASRDMAASARLLPAGAHYVAADLGHPEKAAGTIAAALDGLGIERLDLAVLNAGHGIHGAPEAEMAGQVRRTLDVNLAAPVFLAHHLAGRLEKAAGRLVLIGSVAHRGSPATATYSASKAGLAGFARSLREEWRGRIKVQMIHPGPTATAMHAKAGYDPGRLSRLFMTPADMAAAIEEAIALDRSPVTISFGRRFQRFFRKATP